MSERTAEAQHTWRHGRRLAALAPSHFLVDERSEADLIAFAAELSGLLKFDDGTDGTDKPEQESFRALLENDLTILLAEISVTDAAQYYVTQSSAGVDAQRAASAKTLQDLMGWRARLRHSGGGLVPNPVAVDMLKHYQALMHQELNGLSLMTEQPDGSEDHQLLARRVATAADDRVPVIFSALNRVQQAVAAAAHRHLDQVLSQRDDHPAHIGLYLAFARLMRTAQGHLNSLTERHLDHFYLQHLKLAPEPPKPDQAHVWFEPIPGRQSQRLPAGTTLGAGITPDGRAIEFATSDDLMLTPVRIEKMRALQVERGAGGTVLSVLEASGLEAVEIPEQAKADGGGWRPFGPWDDISGIQRRSAGMGLEVSAPILALADGYRTIRISLIVNSPATLADLRKIGDKRLFKHSVTVADGYYDVPGDVEITQDAIVFTLNLDVDAPPVEPLANSGMRWPAWRMRLADDWQDYAYSRLTDVELHDVKIAVSVQGMRSVKVRSPEGPVDTTKPFAPFGGIPVPGSALSLAADEWKGRNLTKMWIEADWANLPRDLGAYFRGYGQETETGSYRAMVTRLLDNHWQDVEPDPAPGRQAGMTFPLFATPPPPLPPGANAAEREDQAASGKRTRPRMIYRFQFPPSNSLPRDGKAKPHGSARAGEPDGTAFRLTLAGPLMAFGHMLYPGLIADASLNQALALSRGPIAKMVDGIKKQAKAVVASVAKKIGAASTDDAKAVVALRPPFTPMIRDFVVGYEAEALLNLAGTVAHGEVRRLESFGRERQIPSKSSLLEKLDASGYLYFGLSGVDLLNRHPLTLLFHINDQAGENWSAGGHGGSTAVNWHYLSHTGWVNFPPHGVLMDQTRGLIRSGIVKLDPQRGMVGDTDSPDLVWISVSANGNTDRLGAILSVHTHGVSAVRRTPPEAVNGRWVLPAGSIKQLASLKAQVTAVHQPFETQDGQPPETKDDFRLRVSERLRHKNRAVVPRDYEQLTLARFPQVGDAKCLTGPEGQVTLAVAPVRTTRDTTPKISAGDLSDIAEYLRPLMPAAAADPIVCSPGYDHVRVSAWIDADDRELDALLFGLGEAADRVIAPWLFDPKAPLSIGPGESHVDVSRMQQALSEVPLVRAVSGVSLVRFSVAESLAQDAGQLHNLLDTAAVGDPVAARHAAVVASSERSVLTPASRHRFRILSTPRVGSSELRQDFRVALPDEAQSASQARRMAEMERASIGNLSIGSELVICRSADEVAGMHPVFRVRRQLS